MAERRAISRARLDEVDLAEAKAHDTPPTAKIALTKGIGCMAVLGCIFWYSFY
jgi:hypothetical protein